jgi:hypothetical protein
MWPDEIQLTRVPFELVLAVASTPGPRPIAGAVIIEWLDAGA